MLSQTFHYPENSVFASQYSLITQAGNKHFIIWERYFSEAEITALIKDAGFHKVSVYKNIVGGNDFTANCEMFVVAEK